MTDILNPLPELTVTKLTRKRRIKKETPAVTPPKKEVTNAAEVRKISDSVDRLEYVLNCVIEEALEDAKVGLRKSRVWDWEARVKEFPILPSALRALGFGTMIDHTEEESVFCTKRSWFQRMMKPARTKYYITW